MQNVTGDIYAHVEDAITFEVGQSPLFGTNMVDGGFGVVFTKVEVTISPTPVESPVTRSTTADPRASRPVTGRVGRS